MLTKSRTQYFPANRPTHIQCWCGRGSGRHCGPCVKPIVSSGPRDPRRPVAGARHVRSLPGGTSRPRPPDLVFVVLVVHCPDAAGNRVLVAPLLTVAMKVLGLLPLGVWLTPRGIPQGMLGAREREALPARQSGVQRSKYVRGAAVSARRAAARQPRQPRRQARPAARNASPAAR